jgi:hypothetical protein
LGCLREPNLAGMVVESFTQTALKIKAGNRGLFDQQVRNKGLLFILNDNTLKYKILTSNKTSGNLIRL